MTNEEMRAQHPRRAGIGDALAMAFPLPDRDREEQAERHALRRLELKEAVRAKAD